MIAFNYDGSLEGLFCTIFDAYTSKIFPKILIKPDDIPPLLATEIYEVITESDHAQRVFTGLRKKLPECILSRFMYVWLSEEEQSDTLLFQFMRMVFDSKKPLFNDFSDPLMLRVENIEHKVRNEAHLMKGFIRFQKTKEAIFLGCMGPRHNILPLIIPHFRTRFGFQKFALYDEKRDYGIYYDGTTLHDILSGTISLKNGQLPSEGLAEEELLFQKTWKEYCKHLTIQERENKALQKRLMPRRFWNYMIETH